jgi:hypothetical protein
MLDKAVVAWAVGVCPKELLVAGRVLLDLLGEGALVEDEMLERAACSANLCGPFL